MMACSEQSREKTAERKHGGSVALQTEEILLRVEAKGKASGQVSKPTRVCVHENGRFVRLGWSSRHDVAKDA